MTTSSSSRSGGGHTGSTPSSSGATTSASHEGKADAAEGAHAGAPLPDLTHLLSQTNELFDQVLAGATTPQHAAATFLDDFNDLWRNLSSNWEAQLSNLKNH